MRSGLVTRSPYVLAVFLSLGLCASFAEAQGTVVVQLNKRYYCPDNIMDFTVKRCEAKGGAEVCVVEDIGRNGRSFGETTFPKGRVMNMVRACPSTTPPSDQTVSQPSSQPPAQQVTGRGAPDPSIAKARSANVDTKVFGIPLGESLQLPECPWINLDNGKNCFESTLRSRYDLVGEEQARTLSGTIHLSSATRPAWAHDSVDVWAYDGVLVSFFIETKGHTVDVAVARELRAKYGPPTSVRSMTITPSTANPFDANDLEWLLPGLHVLYEVAQKGKSEGEIKDYEKGLITIETDAAYRRRLAREKAEPKHTL